MGVALPFCVRYMQMSLSLSRTAVGVVVAIKCRAWGDFAIEVLALKKM